MSLPSDPASSFDARGKFAAGNKMSRGNPMGRATELFRTQIIRELKVTRSIPRLVKRLGQLAAGSVPIRIRSEGEKTKTVWAPVDPAVQLGAIRELLSRAVGKATEYKVIDDHRDKADTGVDFERLAAALVVLRTPEEEWPPQVRDYYAQRKQIVAKVI